MRFASNFLCFFLIILSFAFSGCERIDLDEETSTTSTEKVVPVGHGQGTQELPLTARELQNGAQPQSATECWVIGYVVGSTYKSMNNALFQSSTSYDANILLSNDSLCSTSDDCIAVELSSKSMKSSFSLLSNPSGWRKVVILCGTWGRYFNRYGLRSVTKGYFLPDFDMGTIVPSPFSWTVVDTQY